ncbi:GNAT family N-acetyltransferase [Photobacterium sp. 1_MG-2023]|uniref:GNAT family N-acetyltransferase n=1 Tax=Photobacterium sp. 1_MG-2023 TaxID=3062646 RepID=UPI0026E23167|nr:GNAT family N-acetyltransferase [Photobacterium sp. 1_MG-2023]MDO6706891.1 GNAT family N-acetyltransferase [Photobacterium sp. 1_MG-2023]
MIDIEPVTRAERARLVDIFLELEAYYFADQAASQSEIEAYLTDSLFAEHSGVRVVAAYTGGVIVGFATYSILYPSPKLSGQMFMKDLFVAASARGQKVGQALMRYLAKDAFTKGCRRLDWTAERTNPGAGRFYQSIGASQVAEKEYYRFSDEALAAFASGRDQIPQH